MNKNPMQKGLPWALTTAAARYFIFAVVSAANPSKPPETQFNLRDFALLPVVDRGRVQPMDSVARVNLLLINNRQDFVEKQNGPKRPALEWLLDTMVAGFQEGKAKSDTYPIFRIDNGDLLNTLKLPLRPNFYRYSYN